MEHITLKKNIMRRVYYAYTLRLVTMPGVLQGVFTMGALIALTHFVSIGNVIQNLMGVPVGRVGVFFLNALKTTEIWTLLFLGIIIFSLLSFRFKMGTFRNTPVFVKV